MKKIFISVIFLFLLKIAYAQDIEKYKCIEVRTDLVSDEILYAAKKENTAEFELKQCLPENLKIQIKQRKITYGQSRRLVEDGKIEKNDLFSIECSQPQTDDTNIFDYQIEHRYYRGKISPLISPDYPLYPTIKQVSENLNLDMPQRTFIILNRNGSASYEFFCYADKKLSQDKCSYTFDEILNIHAKEQNTVAISNLAEKYLKKLDYEKAEKAYKKLVELSDDSGYEGLLNIYMIKKDYKKAENLLSKRLKDSPFDTSLYIPLAKVYLYQKEYKKAKSIIQQALKLRFENGLYEIYGILGEIYIAEKNYDDAVLSFDKASKLLKKECEDKSLVNSFLNREALPPNDCEIQTVSYQLKTMYSLTELEKYDKAEKLGKELLAKIKDNPGVYGHLAFLYAGKGEFDKAISLLKRRGIGANIVKGEIYPIIVSIDRNTAAEKSGLKRGDKIINIGNKDLRLFREGGDIIQMLVNYINTNETVKLTIHRENSVDLKDVELKPGEFTKPEASEPLAFKALILKVAGKRAEFEKESLKAFELNPEDKLAQTVMTLLNSDRGRHDEAIKILEKASKDSNDSLVMLIKPIVYAKAGKINQAKEFYKEIPEELLKTKNALYKRLLDERKGVLK